MSLLLADFVVVLHLLFILFVILGGLLVLKWHGFYRVHVPCALYGAMLELFGWTCPLTYLENHLRHSASGQELASSFIQHYLLPIIYPGSLTGQMQILLGVFTILINLFIYLGIWRHITTGGKTTS